MVQCNNCKTELSEADENHLAVCPACGHVWQLNDDNTAIKSVTVVIKDVEVKLNAHQLLRGVKNALHK